MAQLLTLERFKSLARKGEVVPSDALIRKDLYSTVESLEDRKVRFTISTGAVDRALDTVAVDGWELDNYRNNPVVLWGHDSWELPIGRCIELGSDGAALKATVEFVPEDMPVIGGRAEAVLRMCRTGFLSATSVGFRPLEYELAKERMDEDDWFPPFDFKRQELMEFSVVAIPCNPEALIEPAERRTLTVPPGAPQLSADELAAKEAEAAEQARLKQAIARGKRDRAARQRRARVLALT